MPKVTGSVRYSLFNENCLEGLLKLRPGSVDLVLADPPYGVTWAEWDSILPFKHLWNLLLRVAKPNAAIVLMSCQPFTTQLINSQHDIFRYVWYWDKNGHTTGHLLAPKKPMRVLEELVVFYREQPTYNPKMSLGLPNYGNSGGGPGLVYGHYEKPVQKKSENRNKRYPTNLIKFSPAGKRVKKHPHEKPVSLMQYMVETYTNPGETVLDFCMGAGTTGVASARAGRKFIGYEIGSEFFKIAQRRIEAAYSENQ